MLVPPWMCSPALRHTCPWSLSFRDLENKRSKTGCFTSHDVGSCYFLSPDEKDFVIIGQKRVKLYNVIYLYHTYIMLYHVLSCYSHLFCRFSHVRCVSSTGLAPDSAPFRRFGGLAVVDTQKGKALVVATPPYGLSLKNVRLKSWSAASSCSANDLQLTWDFWNLPDRSWCLGKLWFGVALTFLAMAGE